MMMKDGEGRIAIIGCHFEVMEMFWKSMVMMAAKFVNTSSH